MAAASGICVGLRVVRGADWQWADQDGGEGHVGTVVEIGGQGSNKNPDKTVVVLWDAAIRCNYRAGYQGKDDLRVLDSAPAGSRHGSVTCDICRMSGICGLRWKCMQCNDFDLCNDCYMSNKHDIAHTFLRFDTPLSQGVLVTARSKSRRMQAKGIYVGATVVRGPDWKYSNQDGGAGKRGMVKSIGDASDSDSWRSWVKVKWEAGLVNDYRRGYEGSLDIKFVSAANGEEYYVDHLPKLSQYGANCFVNGDRVRINPDVLSPSERQNLAQAGLLSASGTLKVGDDGHSFEVAYASRRLTLPSSHLLKVRKLAVGDTVKILDDAAKVQQLQSGHGGWNGQMAAACGKTGNVIAIDSDGDVKVAFGASKWIFNPDCCVLVSEAQGSTQASNQTVNAGRSDSSDDDDEDVNDMAAAGFVELMRLLMGVQYTGLSPDRIVKEAAEGNVANVRRILSEHPSQVDVKSQNRTALQVAVHQGHLEIVALLLNAGARPDIKDDDGDNAYHYAAYGNQPAAMELLLKKSTAAMNATNKNGRTSLQVSVCKQHVECVRALMTHNAGVNIQDSDGDTPLHDAVLKENKTIIDLLVNCGSVDFKLKNNKGFNVLHQAARHGNQYAVDKIIRKAPQFVNVPKDDGFTALHLATLNGFVLTATLLIEVGKANLEMTTAKFNTPLLIAVDNGQTPLIELLVNKGANLEAEDADGDTALHLVLLQMKNSRQAQGVMTLMLNVLFKVQPKNVDKAPAIKQIMSQFGGTPTPQLAWLSIACYLVTKGSDVDHKNRANKSPMDEVADAQVRELLLKCKPAPKRPAVAPKPAPPPPVPKPRTSGGASSSMCMMCTSEPVAVTFRPCGHQVACKQCSSHMKQCFSCHERIQEKVRIDIQAHSRPETARVGVTRTMSNNFSSAPPVPPPRRPNTPADTVNCPICETNVRNVVFQCGHSCCSDCSKKPVVQSSCHVCGQTIQKRINLF